MDVMGGYLSDYMSVKGRFARSVRLDHDADHAERLEGYIPTGRSLEVIRRVVGAMVEPDGTRAFSITGPYGSGKSSLALFIDALLGPTDDPGHKAALRILREFDGETARRVGDARRSLGGGPAGFIRAIVTTPQREPITTTVLRALLRGAERARVASDVRSRLSAALDRAESGKYASPTYAEIRRLCEALAERKPLLIVIDEFGKNLEAYADSGREGDLYLLQELAEWASGADPLPLVLITIQHLAFEAYASDATSTQRREWAKVQGRFEDIPFIDSGATSRALIAAALDHTPDPIYRKAVVTASKALAAGAEASGLPAIAGDELIAACYPLHPVALLVLPELCARYGQNERTLFSFLSSQEPRSVMSFARTTQLSDPLTWVHLDQIYDYFVESAATFVGASQDASRWIEIETIIRDAQGLSDLQLSVLKTVGVLNLVGSGGSLRASPEMVVFAFAGHEQSRAVLDTLAELEHAGMVTFRDFAGEYRAWRGTDFDLSSALRSARRQVRQQSVAQLLDSIQPMRPLVASRHSIRSGTTRAFARLYADRRSSVPDIDRRADRSDREAFDRFLGTDGLLLYVVDPDGNIPAIEHPASGLPVVTVVPNDPSILVDAATEVGALLEIASDPNLPTDDRVARRELTERTAYARQVLDSALAEAFSTNAEWTWLNASGESVIRPERTIPLRFLSGILDSVFSDSPPISNETINRTELSSQGARARRNLLEALLTPAKRRLPRLGLSGDSPEVSMYRAVLEDSGIHEPMFEENSTVEGSLGHSIKPPWNPVWNRLSEWLSAATEAPVSVAHLLDKLSQPPFGIKAGPAAVLLTASLVAHASEIAVYEHGTFRPRLDSPLVERLVRNPENFAIKHLAAGIGSKRHRALEQLGKDLSVVMPHAPTAQAAAARPTVLTVALALVDVLQRRSDRYTHKTLGFHSLWSSEANPDDIQKARRVRDALLTSQEPDVLLFEALPTALGFGPLTASGRGAGTMTAEQLGVFTSQAAHAVALIDHAQARLAEHLEQTICDAAGCNTLEETISRANDLQGVDVLTDDVRQFVRIAGMKDLYSDHVSWLSAVTEIVCSSSFLQWTDHTLLGHVERLRQVAADHARVADLARFTSGRFKEAFRAYQLDITGQDGVSSREVIAIPERVAIGMADAAEEAIRLVAAHMEVDQTAAREALLAWLAADRLGYRDEPQPGVEDTDEQRKAASDDR